MTRLEIELAEWNDNLRTIAVCHRLSDKIIFATARLMVIYTMDQRHRN
jgi:hypothetical protein